MKNFCRILILFAFAFITTRVSAQSATQDYTFSAGLRFGGYEFGPSAKYFVGNDNSVEAMLGFRSSGIVITGLYEWNTEAFNTPALKFYYGFGGHIGSLSGHNPNLPNPNNQVLLGGDGIIGLEYILPLSPIAVSVDLDPRLEFTHGPTFDIAPGVGVKYFFK